MFRNRKTHILMIPILIRLIYRFNIIPAKIPPGFMGLWKLNSDSSDSMIHWNWTLQKKVGGSQYP